MKIIFICTGNICRSAMAHKLLEKISVGKNVQIYSAGIYAIDGDKCTKEAKEVMKNYNIDMSSHRATNIKNVNLKDMDIILCATAAHKNNLINMYPDLRNKIFTMKEYAGGEYLTNDLDIKDPWGMNLETYERCAKEIYICLEKINIKL